MRVRLVCLDCCCVIGDKLMWGEVERVLVVGSVGDIWGFHFYFFSVFVWSVARRDFYDKCLRASPKVFKNSTEFNWSY